MVFFKHFIFFLVIAIIAGAINFATHKSGIHLHLGHVSFLSVISTLTLGFKYGIIMIIIGHIIPEILSGHFDTEMIIAAGTYSFINVLAVVFAGMPIVTLGITLAVIQVMLGFVLGFFTGAPLTELIPEHGTEFILNLFYYWKFAVPLLGMLS